MNMEEKVTKTPNSNPVIPDGKHWLTAVEPFHFEDVYNHYDGYVLELDGVPYVAYEDPDDGYRSYTSIRPMLESDNFEIHNRFEPQLVISEDYKIRNEGAEDFLCQYKQQFILKNIRGGIVFEVTTDFSECYYPVGCVKYTPEMLPCNLKPIIN